MAYLLFFFPGILHSRFSSWIEIVQQYGYINGSHSVTSTQLNVTPWFNVESLDTGKSLFIVKIKCLTALWTGVLVLVWNRLITPAEAKATVF